MARYRSRYRYGYGYGWKPYVPVAKRRAQAAQKINKLRKKGMEIQPVEIEGRQIAQTFWGRAWCKHLEQFSDYANRLPRGRTYVRNGSVCHLEIKTGAIKAMVSGSRLYNVNVKIKKLPRKKWIDVKKQCAGGIGSLLELLEGRLSKSVMEIVTNRDNGLFPLPKEISLDCDCPDWATMCKHVASVLYGVGARLDEKPELLFRLRGVNHEELIIAEADVAAATAGGRGRGRRLVAEDLSEVFGIEMAEEGAGVDTPAEEVGARPRGRKKTKAPVQRSDRPVRKKRAPGKTARPVKERAKEKVKPRRGISRKTPALAAKGRSKKGRGVSQDTVKESVLTGRAVALLRKKFDMSRNEFALLLGVSVPTIFNWEKKRGRLNLRTRSLDAWRAVAKLSRKGAWERLDGP